MTKVPEHVRAAAIAAAHAKLDRFDPTSVIGQATKGDARTAAEAVLAVIEAHLDAYCDASNPAWTQPQQLYRFKGRDE